MFKMPDSPSTSTTASSLIKTRRTDASLRKIDLIGVVSHQITGAKLPSNRQVLQVFFYNMRFVCVKPDANESARLALDAVIIFWQQARIPTSRMFYCVERLKKLYDKWKAIQKVVPEKRSDFQKDAANTFVDSLDDLFDVASANALQEMGIEDDKQFLIMQRQKGRPGCMAGNEMTLFAREKQSTERSAKEQMRKRKYEGIAGGDVAMTDEHEGTEGTDDDDNNDEPTDAADDNVDTKRNAKRGRKKWITPRLLSALESKQLKN